MEMIKTLTHLKRLFGLFVKGNKIVYEIIHDMSSLQVAHTTWNSQFVPASLDGSGKSRAYLIISLYMKVLPEKSAGHSPH